MHISFSRVEKKLVSTVIADKIQDIKAKMMEHTPTELYNSQYSNKKPFIIFSDYEDDGSFKMFCTAWADKTPVKYDSAKLHSFLKYQGLESCYFEPQKEQHQEIITPS